MEVAATGYHHFHRQRFAYAVATARGVCPDRSADVLDVGRGDLSLELLRTYDNVTTLGFPLQPHDVVGLNDPGARRSLKAHIDYDLKQAQSAPPPPVCTTCCSRPRRRPCSPSPPTHVTSVPASASPPCCIPGARR